MVDPELDYYAYSYHDSYYNQPQENTEERAETAGKKGILSQFKRR